MPWEVRCMSLPAKTFYITMPDAVTRRKVNVEQELSVGGVSGFALHREGPDDFRVSHMETGALAGRGRSAELALRNASENAAGFDVARHIRAAKRRIARAQKAA